MVKSLKKAMAPVLSDVTVEWVFPETTEALISPVSTSSLFPGERLVGYGIVCDASLYISNSRSVSTSGYLGDCLGSCLLAPPPSSARSFQSLFKKCSHIMVGF